MLGAAPCGSARSPTSWVCIQASPTKRNNSEMAQWLTSAENCRTGEELIMSIALVLKKLLDKAAVDQEKGHDGGALSSSLGDALFFRQYYLDNNPDVLSSGLDPLDHFNRYGKYEGRNPNPFLDLLFYRNHMMHIAPGFEFDNAYDHFVGVGLITDLWPSAFFDPVYYRTRYSHLEGRYISLCLSHFLEIGALKGYFCTHPSLERHTLL